PADAYKQVTLRQTMRLSLGGKALRVRLSNLYGKEPLVIGAATLRLADRDGAGGTRPFHTLRFSGASKVSVAPGTELYSDPLDGDFAGGDDVTVSLYVDSGPAVQSAHVAAHASQYIAAGDQTGRATLDGARRMTSWFHIGAVEVAPVAAAPVLVAIGDSITDGSGSTDDQNERWTDYLARRLKRQPGAPAIGVINASIGGNQMLRDDLGQKLLERFERDVLGRAGVTHTLILIGVNDLGRLHKGGAETAQSRAAMLGNLQAGWRQMIAQAHARGVCVLAGTLTPYGGSTLYKPDAANEADRQTLNQWLRDSADIDGVADFDAAVRDPAAPERLQARFDSGDHLHLSPAGYGAMGDAVPIERLKACAIRR
ncbi:MAG: SGNH/GDSL hydrolase family protein, partial [Massilia sp.]